RLGFAEADPSEDVNGKDAAAKMAILARLAFGTPVHLDQVPCEGIERITPDELEYASEFGLSLKLIGTAERVDGGLAVGVPAALPLVSDVDSAFYLHLEVADKPGVLAQIAQVLGLQGISVKSVLQKGLGEQARLVMVIHPVAESRFFAAVDMIGGLDFMRST